VGHSLRRPLLVVPNLTAHPSTASVPTLYYSMWPLESKGLNYGADNDTLVHRIITETVQQLTVWLQKQEVKVIGQKAPHGGPILRLGVTPGGRKLYH